MKRRGSKIHLFIKTLVAFLCGLLITGAILFVPAGTLDYPGAWLFMALLFTPVLIMGVVLMAKNPELLRKRLAMKEREKTQQGVVALSGLLLVAAFIVAGLDFRYGWTSMPMGISYTGCVILLISYGLFAEVLRENTWLSRTIEVQEGQTVVSTGLYGIVRHPMYFATVFLFLAMPVILGSWASFVIFLAYPFIIAKRIRNEEEVLERELKGYKEYKNKVKYRMIPFIW